MKTAKTNGAVVLVLALVAGTSQPVSAATSTLPTPAAARAEAAKINLVGTDVPGWKPSPNVNSSTDNAMSNRLASCVGTHPPSGVNIVDINSPYFDLGNAEVTSNVAVVPRPKRRRPGPGCHAERQAGPVRTEDLGPVLEVPSWSGRDSVEGHDQQRAPHLAAAIFVRLPDQPGANR